MGGVTAARKWPARKRTSSGKKSSEPVRQGTSRKIENSDRRLVCTYQTIFCSTISRYEALMEEYLERGYREQAVKQGTLYKGEGDRVALPKHRLDDDGELGQDGMGDAEAVALKAAEVAKVSS